MARLINTQTKVVVNVDDSKVARLGPLYQPLDAEKPTPAKAPSKSK